MSLPTSETALANLALDKVGQGAITSLTGTTDTAVLVNRNFGFVRQKLLREYPWNFAMQTTTLSRTGDAPGTRYDDAYLLPPNCLRVINVGPDTADRISDYQIQTQANGSRILICSNGGESTVEFTGIYDVTDVTKWDALFKECFVLSLALAICYAITKSNTTWERINRELKEAMPSAISVDGQEQPPERIENSRFLAARSMGIDIGVASRYTILDGLM